MIALRGFIAVLAAMTLFGLRLGITKRAELVAQFPGLGPVFPLYVAAPALSLAGLAALWLRRRWGLWLCLALGAVVLGIELVAMGPMPHVARVPASMVLLAWLSWRVRDRLLPGELPDHRV